MIGGAVFTIFKSFVKRRLLRPESDVKNIALVLGMLYDSTADWPSGEEEPELAWRGAMIRKAQQHGIVFKDAPYGIEDRLKRDGLNEPQEDKDDSEWNKFSWYKEVSWQDLSPTITNR